MRQSLVGRIFTVAALMLVFTSWAGSTGSRAESIESEASFQEPPCSGDEYRQFDFWIGDWSVTAGDRTAGQNRITSILGGCVLLEQYKAAGGAYEGSSFNIYDQGVGEWHQTWVDNQGLVLQLRGGVEDGQMVLSGERQGQDGTRITDRIAWTPRPDGTVRQLWQVSEDGGETWRTVFDGTYTREE